jgi:dTDP-4-dehydrorhamnose 3,5-epimerase
MRVERLAIDGPLLMTPQVFADERGYFLESWNQRIFAEALGVLTEASPHFCQDNQSGSKRGVLRGLHYQLEPEPQGKLVRCVAGEIFDVAVDIRRSSPSFGQWVGARLNAENHHQLWIPVGFAHGFLTISEQASVLYKASGFWSRQCERSLRWDDPDLAIDWPMADLLGSPVQLAAKDDQAPLLSEAIEKGDLFQ